MPFDAGAGLFWLLLPVAAASGWWIGRRERSRTISATGHRIQPAYFQGLNYLLNEQPDKAIEVFLKLAEIDSETVETHFALGNLFRRRGEVDRAIRIHQNLIDRHSLSPEHHELAILELGVDYLRSGLLDRAEAFFQGLLESRRYGVLALRHLVEIYQQEQDWDSAITYARRLEKAANQDLSRMIAHFYCEQADQARRRNDIDKANQLLESALKIDHRCVRASLVEGEIAAAQGEPDKAIAAFLRILKQDDQLFPEVVAPLSLSYQELGQQAELVKQLQQLAVQHPSTTVNVAVARLLEEQHGMTEAVDYLRSALIRSPTARGLEYLIDLTKENSETAVTRLVDVVRRFIERLQSDRARYRCSLCGFSGKRLHWQCPGCKQWNCIKPIYGPEGE
jgi:lipopolysaccharide biosynthesis regulator YciM